RMQQWDSAGQWASFSKQWATDVAFDVYLDQEVPDCHG
ncbi:MAG: ABC transporter substrate-binding protein, partial [Advenella sp.]